MSVYVVALAAEARPLIDALKLKRKADKPWPYYSNGEEYLVLSGIGQLNAAAASAWLFGCMPLLARSPWINLGIGGHHSYELGQLLWIERLVRERGDFFPALHFSTQLAGASLLSVDSPRSDYPEAAMVDMEGLGFYMSCSRFVPLELLHLLKVVSDNSNHPIEKFDKQQVSHLINKRCEEILEFSAGLTQLSLSLPECNSPGFENCAGSYLLRWRFSHSQTLQLQKLLHRYFAMTQSLWQCDDFDSPPRDAKQVLSQLNEKIEQLPVRVS